MPPSGLLPIAVVYFHLGMKYHNTTNTLLYRLQKGKKRRTAKDFSTVGVPINYTNEVGVLPVLLRLFLYNIKPTMTTEPLLIFLCVHLAFLWNRFIWFQVYKLHSRINAHSF